MGGNKRPREGTPPPKESKKKESKAKKKQKKNKQQQNKTDDDQHHHHHQGSSLDTTATAEGQIMAQMLSTFSSMEQSRFEAFRRATFCGDAICKFVAHCLATDNRSLSDLVAPGKAEEITVVVSTLAKAYAQRLITAAAAVERNTNGQNNPISPRSLWQAWSERHAAGLDPGFFLQPHSTGLFLLSSNNNADRHEQMRLAALEAQELYDAAKKKEEEEAREKAEAEEKAKLEAEAKAKEAEAKANEAEKARMEAEEKAKREAEEKAKMEAEEAAKMEAEVNEAMGLEETENMDIPEMANQENATKPQTGESNKTQDEDSSSSDSDDDGGLGNLLEQEMTGSLPQL